MTEEELQAAMRERDARQEARDIKKASRLGTLAAQMDKAYFREETLRQKLADRRRSGV
jgi:hypothetical protein